VSYWILRCFDAKKIPKYAVLPHVFSKQLIKMFLLCNLFQSWAKILLVHIGFELNNFFLHVHFLDELSKTGIWIFCLSKNRISVVYEVLTSKPCFLNLFWLAYEYNILTQLFCVLSKNHFRQIWKLRGFGTTATIYILINLDKK